MKVLGKTASKRNPIVIQLSDFGGRRLLDIRRYFLDRETSELKPTKKGIALNKANFSEVTSMIAENIAEIGEWYQVGKGASGLESIVGTVEQTWLREASAQSVADQTESRTDYTNFGDRRFPFPFAYEATGGSSTLSKNNDHPLVEEIRALSNRTNAAELEGLISLIFESYFRAARRLEATSADGYIDPEALELEWDREMKTRVKAVRSGNQEPGPQ